MHAATVAAMAKRKSTPDIRERFGDAVRASRERLELTQEEFAERAKIHRTYLSDIERGKRNVSLINIERIAAALTIPLPALFELVECP
jgi:transcriptional regulator with XRE-family HTH domain